MDKPRRALIFPSMTQHDTDVIIVGGSLTGATLAVALRQAGLRVAILDARPDSDQRASGFDGRSYAVAAASGRLLQTLRLWEALAPGAQPMEHIRVGDGRAGRGPGLFTLHFDAAELGEGPMGHMVEDRHLRAATLDALTKLADGPDLIRRTGCAVTDQHTGPGGVQVQLADGTTLTGAVLIGADGLTSGTGARAGIERRVTDYAQTALVCAIGHERPHDATAYQLFLPPGPLAVLPLKGHRSSIVWTETRDQAAAIQALDDPGYLEVLRPRFGDFLGEIAIAGARYTYPLVLSQAAAFTANRVALVGDAARRVHPIAGQGLNAGLRDVAALAEVLAEAHRRGEDLGSKPVLDRYARWRRFDSAALGCATDGFNRLFSNDNPLLRLGRGLGLGAVGAVPAARRAFMREAMGLTGDVPRLMQGKPA